MSTAAGRRASAMGRRRRPTGRGARLRARQSIWASCAVALLAIAFATFLSFRPLQSASSEIRQSHSEDLALQQVADLRTTLTNFQLLLEPSLTTAQSAATTADGLAKAAQLAQTENAQTQAVLKTLRAVGFTRTADELRTTNAAFTKAYTGLAPLAAGVPVGKLVAPIAAERATFSKMWSVTATAATQLRQANNADFQKGMQHLNNGHITVIVVSSLAALVALSAAFMVGQRAHRRERAERRNDRRQSFATSLQEALDMSKAEPNVYGTVGKALKTTLPHLQVELLVADSSRAHFTRALSTGDGGPENSDGCGVVSPLDCPATIRGHTLVFATSNALNACPYLQGRPSGECSAACIPISIAGNTVGVTHAIGPDRVPPNATDIGYLEITSRRASERLAMLRAFEKSETQASSDPLTGLFNRRSLENQVRDLQRRAIPYGLAYADLDHFKLLNDTHGHETGDQALRLFSRVLRDSVRPNDIVARYGGEEFVIVLPDCNKEAGTLVLERVREHLALALTTGRVPAFTASFGLASSGDADTFDEVVAFADKALLAAKDAGRNRVVVAVKTADHPAARGAAPISTELPTNI